MAYNYQDSYVFEQVFNKCKTLSSQVRMARALPQNLYIAIRIWRKCCHTNTVGPESNFSKILIDLSDYLFFMRHMAPHFKTFAMFDFGRRDDKFENLRQYFLHLKFLRLKKFPSIKGLQLLSFTNSIEDADILDLTKMMPNLKGIYINCNLCTVAHVDKFKKLEQLHLGQLCDYESATKTQTIQNIITTMHKLRVLDINGIQFELTDINLPNLESLTLDPHTLSYIIEQVLVLPRLQNLTVYGKLNYKNLFGKILQEKASKITGVFIDNSLLKLEQDWDKKLGCLEFPKLCKIGFEYWKYSNFFLSGHKFDRGQIKTIVCDHWKCLGEHKLMKMIKDHHNLQKLSIRHCGIRQSAIKSIESLLKYENETINNVRKTSMISTLQHTNPRPKLVLGDFCDFWIGLKPEKRTYWQNNQYIEIESNESEMDFPEPYGYKFEFDTA